jgi:hypothetical protein
VENTQFRENLKNHLESIVRQGVELGEIAGSLLETRTAEDLNELDNEIVLTVVGHLDYTMRGLFYEMELLNIVPIIKQQYLEEYCNSRKTLLEDEIVPKLESYVNIFTLKTMQARNEKVRGYILISRDEMRSALLLISKNIELYEKAGDFFVGGR